LFFCPQKVEKTTLKSCSEFSNPLFFPYCPDCPNGPDFHLRFIKTKNVTDVASASFGGLSLNEEEEQTQTKNKKTRYILKSI
jgi:hypothetical protein